MRSILAILLAGISLALPQGATGSANQLPSTFTWYVEDRFGSHLQAFYGPDGRLLAQVPVVTPSQEYIHSPGRTVQFDACAADQDQAATYGWRIDNGPRVTAGCRYEHAFSTPGPHEVDLTITGVSGRSTSSTQTIDLRDYLIVSLGDSYASGEGNPEVPGTYTIAFPPCRQAGKVQLMTPCVQAALSLEREDPHSTVTFVSLACSGATIEEGLLGRQVNRPSDRPSQVDALTGLLCPPAATCAGPDEQRRVDALVISIGGNDIGFSDIVKACIRLVGACTGDTIPEDSPVGQARPKRAWLGLR